MSELKVKTRGDSKAQGKPRVFFSCHPDDFEKYFIPVSSEILKLQNCAVYYEDKDDELIAKEDIRTSFGQMQLLVVPVTLKWLKEDSRSRDFIWPLAEKEHIPILPILAEEGLDKLIYENMLPEGAPDISGFQFLIREGYDSSAISYEEKLKRFLSEVFVTDQFAEKARAAFDAYIFMSYRKKDRAESLKLMKLIHDIPMCESMAIWYDEYLVPGEEWNEAIARAMAKSDFVVMTVTENITEPGNYVMAHEYPRARESGKDILPVEMGKPDIEELKKYFDGIPELVDGRNEEDLSRALSSLIKDLAIEEGTEPEHDFFIGLAYLEAIDVERNPQKALSLITKAAEEGLPEAMKKLSDMYITGNGIKRDLSRGVFWLEKYTDRLKGIYDADISEEKANAYFDALWDLSDLLLESERITEAAARYKEMADAAGKISGAFKKPGFKRYIYLGYLGLADSYALLGQFKGAEKYYNKSEKQNLWLVTTQRDILFVTDLIRADIKHGDFYMERLDIIGAETAYEDAVNFSEALVKEDLPFGADYLAFSCQKMAACQSAKGKHQKASKWLERAQEERQRALKENVDEESRSGLLITNLSKANHELLSGNFQEASDLAREVILEIEDGSKYKDMPEMTANLAAANDIMGSCFLVQGDIFDAASCFEKAISIYRSLEEYNSTMSVRRSRCNVSDKLAQAYIMAGQPVKAQTLLEETLKEREEINRIYSSPELEYEINSGYIALGDFFFQKGDPDKARMWYQKADPNDDTDLIFEVPKKKLIVAESLTARARICLSEEDYDGALELYKRAKKLLKRSSGAKEYAVQTKEFLFLVYEGLGMVSQNGKEDISGAISYYTLALNEARELVSKDGLKAHMLMLAEILRMLAQASFAKDDSKKAEKLYREALKITDSIMEGYGEAAAKENLGYIYLGLGYIADEKGDFAKAIGFAKKGADIFEELISDSEDPAYVSGYKDACESIIYIYESSGEARDRDSIRAWRKKQSKYEKKSS